MRDNGLKEEGGDPDSITIIFAHFHTERGVREALDEIISDYEKVRPGVRVKQSVIPDRIWIAWRTTQLIGGTVPDIIELGRGFSEEQIHRYIIPLTEAVAIPNPYNRGTDLEDISWRETFHGGLSSGEAYNQTTGQVVGIPQAIAIHRVHYNKSLYRRIVGHDRAPGSYNEYLDVLRAAEGYAKAQGLPLVPLVVSSFNVRHTFDSLFASMTHRLAERVDLDRDLRLAPIEIAVAQGRGVWGLASTDVRAGLETMHDVGRFTSAASLQQGMSEAIFAFAQERALMMAIGSFNTTSLIRECPFEIGFFAIPVPGPAHPKYGRYTFGQETEAAKEFGGAMAVTRRSRHPEIAIDFLRYLTSQRVNQKFADLTNWITPVIGVHPNEAMKDFDPIIDGALPGFPLTFAGFGSGEGNRLYVNNLGLLVGAQGSVERFVSAISSDFEKVWRQDLGVEARRRVRSLQMAEVAHFQRVRETARPGFPHDADGWGALLRSEVEWAQARYPTRPEP